MKHSQSNGRAKYIVIGIFALFFIGILGNVYDDTHDSTKNLSQNTLIEISNTTNEVVNATPQVSDKISEQTSSVAEEYKTSSTKSTISTPAPITLSNIPAYSGNPYVTINNNIPFFNESDLTTSSYEKYSELDSLGRCGVAVACIGQDIMPTEKRGEIGSVKPTGWHTVKYNGIDGNYLYNRCHLIGYQLSAENANIKNLITGTRYLNVQGMLPFEDKVANYVKNTNNHVMYRVTPIFDGNNLLASGVLMEAQSVENNSIKFNVYCYNIQPGIEIDYSNGNSSGPEFTGSNNTTQTNIKTQTKTETSTPNNDVSATYILNTNTKKFHKPSCANAKKIKDSNRDTFNGNRQDLINMGYDPCKNCNP